MNPNMPSSGRVDVLAVLQAEAMRLSDAGEHARGDRLIQVSNVVANLIDACKPLKSLWDADCEMSGQIQIVAAALVAITEPQS